MNESRVINTDPLDIKKITKENYKKLHAHKFDKANGSIL